ncbi:MAG: hypothetical protein ACI9FJ_000819 [Alteromonadaceae bacterium]|jgi:hypothetical protein
MSLVLYKLATNQQDEAPVAEDAAQNGPMDAAIQTIQKRITDLQEQMEALKDKEDEASHELLEQLETELMALNVQLMALNNKKLEQLKADKV